MSNTAQLVELEGGRGDHPWGRTFAGYRRDKLSGQVTVLSGDRTFVVAFAGGKVVGARSPLATDAAVRVARLANLISPTQASSFVRKHGASPIGDDVDRLVAHANLSPEHAGELARKVVAHRAARTFSLDIKQVMVEAETSIDIVAGCALDPRAIIYQGARHNLTEHRLTSELARMGSWFRLAPDTSDADLDAYGFGDSERALLDKLRQGATTLELETSIPGIDLRMVRAVLYALSTTDACAAHAARADAAPRTPRATDDELLAPRADLPAPRAELPAPRPVVTLDELIAEEPDLLAPKAPRLDTRDRNDTIVDASTKLDLLGVTVDDRYVLDRKIGEGAMGAVYLAHHTKLDRMFAVKILHRRLVGNAKSRRRFEREAELTGRLSHHNVVRVVDVGTIHDLPYLAMEFAEGASLATIMLDAPLPPSRTIELLRQLCAGLHHAHEAGLVHRDLKPSNVIVDSAGEDEVLRIVDFGIAILGEPEGGERLTTRGVILGTPDYMAPELALGKPIDHRLDLYALGVIAYEMIAGVKPFAGDGVDIALANVNTPVPPMRERAPDVPVDPLLEALARKLLEKDPAARPTDAQEVRRLLDLIEKDRPAAESVLDVSSKTPAAVSTSAAGGVAATPAVVAESTSAVADSASAVAESSGFAIESASAALASVEDTRSAIKTRAMWQLQREGTDPPPVQTKAMWQLRRDGAPTEPPPSHASPPIDAVPTSTRSAAVPTSGPVSTSGAVPMPVPPVGTAPFSASPASGSPATPSSTLAPAPSTTTSSAWARPAEEAPAYVGPTAAPQPNAMPAAHRSAAPDRATRDLPTDEIRPMRPSWLIVAGVAAAVFAIVVIVALASRGSSTPSHDPATHVNAPVQPTPPQPTPPQPTPRQPTPPQPTPPPATDSPRPDGDVARPTPAPAPAPSHPGTVKADTSVKAITALYRTVGTELSALKRAIGNSLTADLASRFRMLHLNAVLRSPARRAAAHEVLTKLLRDINAVRDASRRAKQ